jgi:hypothetical protein
MKSPTDPPNNDKDYHWQKEMTDKYNGRYRPAGHELPEGTFTKSTGEIVNILKNHSPDYKTAMARLNSYINRSGKNLDTATKNRLYQAKIALKNAYGTQVKSELVPIYNSPPNHNFDSSMLDEENGLELFKCNAIARLLKKR